MTYRYHYGMVLGMANILVRGLPDNVKQTLDERAKADRRSTNQTVILAIEAYLAKGKAA